MACDIPLIRVCCTFIGKDIRSFSYFLNRCGRSSSFSGDGLRNKSNRKKTFHPSRHPVIDYLLMVIFDGNVNFVHSNFSPIAVQLYI